MIYEVDKFKKLKNLEAELTIVEDELIKLMPSKFVNFLDLDEQVIPEIIRSEAKHLKNSIDYKDSNFAKLISKYNELGNLIHNEFKFPPNLYTNFMQTPEENLLHTMYVAQYSRVIITKPLLAQYQIKKVLSKSEEDLYSPNSDEAQELLSINFEIPEYLYTNDLGNFDIKTTIENEIETREISIFLSIITEIYILGNHIKDQLENNSHNLFFALVEKKLTEELSRTVSQNICEIYARNIYRQLSEGVKLQNAIDLTKNKFRLIASEYLKTGTSKSDEFKLIATSYNLLKEELKDIKEYDKKFKEELSQEFLRLTLKPIYEWIGMPKNFYKLSFREATKEEKISPEITHALDVFLITADNSLYKNMYETYVINYAEPIKKMMFSIASKGIKNSERVTKLSEFIIEPSPIVRLYEKIKAL